MADNRKTQPSQKGPKMPNMAAISDSRRGGLGRGLASLIPTGAAQPRLGSSAADILLGGGENPSSNQPKEAAAASEQGDRRKGYPSTDKHRHKPSAMLAQASHVPPTAGRGIADAALKPRTTREDHAVDAPDATDAAEAADARSEQSRQPDGTAASSEQSTAATQPAQAPEAAAVSEFGASYREIPLSQIRTNAKQPRTVFDEQPLQELIHSIKEFGLMQPIVVRPTPAAETPYELIMGERRFRAVTEAGFEVIPAIVRETDDEAMLRDALLENIHRVQLNPLEEAAAYQQLLEEFGVTQDQLAAKLGRSRPLITNMIRLLQLPVVVQRRVSAGELSTGHARALLAVRAGVEEQQKLADRIVTEGLSVRATEQAVTALNRGVIAPPREDTAKTPPVNKAITDWADNLAHRLDTRVSVQVGKRRGKIVVEFSGQEEFERISSLLNGGSSGR